MKNTPPKQAEKKVSKIFLEFSEPMFASLPPVPDKESFDVLIRIAIVIWNSVVIDDWNKNNVCEASLLLTWETLPDEAKIIMKRLLKRKKTKFASETWAVGEHWLREEQGQIIFGCEARGNKPA